MPSVRGAAGLRRHAGDDLQQALSAVIGAVSPPAALPPDRPLADAGGDAVGLGDLAWRCLPMLVAGGFLHWLWTAPAANEASTP